MAGLFPATHVFVAATWMPGTSPGMTTFCGMIAP
jgi:hypothetical protein